MTKYGFSRLCLLATAGIAFSSLSACAGQQGHNAQSVYATQGAQSAQYGGHARFENRRCVRSCQNTAQQAATTYAQPTYAAPSSYYSPAPSPQTGYGSGYVGSSSTTSGSTFTSTGSGISTRQVDCPVGTVRQADGSCLQSARTFSTCGSATSRCGNVGVTRHTITTQQAGCPAGTVKQANGSCLQPSSAPTSTRRTGTYNGYNSGGYGLHDYRPVRK